MTYQRQKMWARIVGAILGLAVAGYLWVYAPMRANYEQCGRVTLCETK